MATLQLDRVWVNRMDTGEAVSAYSSGRGRQVAVEGEVRTFAGGRQRSITSAGRRGSMAFTLVYLTSAQVAQLESWVGLEVMYRDHRGQRFVGVFFELDSKEYKEPDRYDIGLTLQEVTWDETPVDVSSLPAELTVS